MQSGAWLSMALIRYSRGPEEFFFFNAFSCVSYLNLTGFICHMSCVKLYPVVLPGGQTEGLRGPRFCKVWQQTAAFTLGKQRENRERGNAHYQAFSTRILNNLTIIKKSANWQFFSTVIFSKLFFFFALPLKQETNSTQGDPKCVCAWC